MAGKSSQHNCSVEQEEKEPTSENSYPRPQFVRNDWISLNGKWEFEFDDQRVGDGEK